MSHKRATDERGLGFGRRQLGGLSVLCTASKDRVTHKLTFRGRSRSQRPPPDIGHSFTHSRCIAVWLESPAAPEPLLGRVHKPFYQDGGLYPSDSAPERQRALRRPIAPLWGFLHQEGTSKPLVLSVGNDEMFGHLGMAESSSKSTDGLSLSAM